MKHRKQSRSFQIRRILHVPDLLLVFIITATGFIGGCASTKDATTAFTPMTVESSKAIVYLYRKSRFVGAANTAEIFINNQHAGKLVSGSYCAHVTDPGPVEIKALQRVPAIFVMAAVISKLMGQQPIFEFTADPGQEYYLEFNVAGYKVKQVAKDEALGLMGALKPAERRTEETTKASAVE